MSILSIEKLNEYKRQKKLTNRKISGITGISIATIDRLFSGANTNPNINLLKQLAVVFGCTIDDFIQYDKNSQSANNYTNKETIKMAQKIQEDKHCKELFDNVLDLTAKDLQTLNYIVERFKNYKI